MRAYLEGLSADLFSRLSGEERLRIGLLGEQTDYVRFNHGRVRQAGAVRQQQIDLQLVVGQRHATVQRNLSGDPGEDQAALRADLDGLRATVPLLAPDPALRVGWDGPGVDRARPGDTPEVAQVIEDVTRAAGEGPDGKGRLDLVGFYAGGRIQRGVLTSTGLRHWFDAPAVSLDWSLHLPPRDGERRAVKRILGGDRWDGDRFRQKMQDAEAELAALERPLHPLRPGSYRAWIAPDAVAELLYCANGFGAMDRQTRSSVWMRQIDPAHGGGGEPLHPALSLTESTATGLGAPFQQSGFLRPDRVELIRQGRLAEPLVNARSAGELGLPCNGANDWEAPESLEMAPGDLPDDQILAALGTGLLVSNLWYCNVSDPSNGRLTGLTRFATLWVEDGKVVGPVPTMRFDDSLSNLFGAALERVGARVEHIPSTDSYHWRSTTSWRLAGLLTGLRLVL